MRELTVQLGERSYPIYIGEGLLDQAAFYFDKHGIGKQSPLLIVTDEQVGRLYLDKLESGLRAAGYRTVSAVVPAGEQAKSLSQFEELITIALKAGLDRKSAIIALGGGVVGDLAGFVAASYMRGIRYVQMPTTILAHDSSVGGKVAVNHPLAKNIIGAFHQPEMVVFELSFLRTLPEREIRAGYAEVIKHALIADAEFFRWVDEQAERLLALDPAAVEHALHTGCRIKADIVSADERENGLRAILNVGHTIGHALEAVAGYGELLHGEAISIGMAGETLLAVHYGCPASVHRETVRVLRKFGLPVGLPPGLDPERIMRAMGHDKKFREGKAVFALPTGIGGAAVQEGVPAELVRDILQQLMREA